MALPGLVVRDKSFHSPASRRASNGRHVRQTTQARWSAIPTTMPALPSHCRLLMGQRKLGNPPPNDLNGSRVRFPLLIATMGKKGRLVRAAGKQTCRGLRTFGLSSAARGLHVNRIRTAVLGMVSPKFPTIPAELSSVLCVEGHRSGRSSALIRWRWQILAHHRRVRPLRTVLWISAPVLTLRGVCVRGSQMAHPKPKRPTGGAVLPPPDPVNRAFVARRELIVRQSVRDPVVRVASFLLYLSNNNVQQGGRATMIGDDLRCGTVAWIVRA